MDDGSFIEISIGNGDKECVKNKAVRFVGRASCRGGGEISVGAASLIPCTGSRR